MAGYTGSVDLSGGWLQTEMGRRSRLDIKSNSSTPLIETNVLLPLPKYQAGMQFYVAQLYAIQYGTRVTLSLLFSLRFCLIGLFVIVTMNGLG